jgi:hypothetical protein
MGLITRGLKASGGTPFVSGFDIDPTEMNTDLDTAYSEFNGNVDNANIKASAAIVGSKIASAPNGVGTSQINDNAVTADKLRDDATTDANRSVTTDHIRDLAVTKGKVAAATLTKAQLDLVFDERSFSFVVGGVIERTAHTGFDSQNYAKATYDIIGAFIKNPSLSGGTGDEWVANLSFDDQTANWKAFIEIQVEGSGGTFAGTTVVILLKKS